MKRVSKNARTATLILLLCIGAPAWCQEESELTYRHSVSLGASVGTQISADGTRTASEGLDYLYRLNRKWEIGVQSDFNYGPKFEGYEGSAIVPVASYEIIDRLPVFFGAGVEHRRHTDETNALVRAGFEYVIFLDEKRRFTFLPGGFVDYIDGEVIVSGVLAIGVAF